MLAYPRGFAFAAADVSRLRKIRVSVNDERHTGTQGHISGLWLEYYDYHAPVILGQWVKELDSLDLSSEERVTELVTWHDYTNRHRRAKYGPIKRLRIGTNHGDVKEFLDSHRGGKICLQYRENPYEKLSGIIWGCNYEWDHVRVFYSPKTGNDVTTRLLMYSGGYSCPPWGVAQKTFTQEAHEDGRSNAITTIEITFKEIASEISGLTFVYEDGRCMTLGVRGADRSDMTPLFGREAGADGIRRQSRASHHLHDRSS